MARQSGWLWGLLPLAMVWGAANVVEMTSVTRDVQRRALAAGSVAGSAPGARAVSIRVDGRDVHLDGEALSADGAAAALAQIGSEFGVRRVLGGLTQVVAQKPYSWSASRRGDEISLSGYVPDEATAKAHLAAVRGLGPSLRIEDRQTVAFGAPAGFADLTHAMIGELGKLSSGKVALDDARFCVEGVASTPDAFLALAGATGPKPPAGFTRVDCPLTPPLVAPYRWSAEKTAAGGVVVSGSYPSLAVKRALDGALGKLFPAPATVTDTSLPASGEPQDFQTLAARALADLARLRSGKVELDGSRYRISGEGPEGFETCEALRRQLAQGPDAANSDGIVCPPPPPPAPIVQAPASPPGTGSAIPELPPAPPLDLTMSPPLLAQPAPMPRSSAPRQPLQWRAEKAAGGVTLSGRAPDAAARSGVEQAARTALAGLTLTDTLRIEPHLEGPVSFAEATGFALSLLGRLQAGHVEISGASLNMAGSVPDVATWTALNEALKARPLPGGLSEASGRVLLRPYDFSATVDESGLTLSGHLPDAGARQAIAALLAESAFKARVTDRTVIVPGAPSGFGVAARAAVMDALRLDSGAARLVDQTVAVQGKTCRDLVRSEIATSVGSELPPGFTGRADVALSQSGCAVDPPTTCQSDLDALTQRYYVMFGQGTAVVTLDPTTERAIGEALAILRQCPTARVVIEGHTNQDGENRGFNNLDLSLRRAGRVRDELVRRGIDPERLSVRGFGVERPLEPHGTSEAKVRNRRVQFTVAR